MYITRNNLLNHDKDGYDIYLNIPLHNHWNKLIQDESDDDETKPVPNASDSNGINSIGDENYDIFTIDSTSTEPQGCESNSVDDIGVEPDSDTNSRSDIDDITHANLGGDTEQESNEQNIS